MSPFYNVTKNKLVDALNRKNEMESNFHPDMIDEYRKIESTIASAAADLLKLGALCSKEKEGIITMLVEDELYEIPENAIHSILGDDLYTILDAKNEEDEEDVSDENEELDGDEDDILKTSMSKEFDNSTYVEPNPYKMNPFFQMFMPFMNMYSDSSRGVNYKEQPSTVNPPSTTISRKEGGFSEVIKNIAGIQSEILLMEQEKNNLKIECDQIKKKYQLLKNDIKNKASQRDTELQNLEDSLKSVQTQLDYKIAELKDKEEEYDKLKSSLEEKIKELQEVIADLRSKVGNYSELEKQNQENLSAVENYKKRINELTRTNNENTEKLRKMERDSSTSFEKDKQNYERRIAELKQQTDAMRERAEKAERLYKEFKDNIDKQNDNSSAKIKESTDKIAALEKEISSLKNEIKMKEEEIKSTEVANEDLKKLAYSDIKTNVKNINAFNKEFKEEDIKGLLLAHICICGMKQINEIYGREQGDKAIIIVANKLLEKFPDAKIYRVYGDQFIIVCRNQTKNSVNGQLEDIVKELLENKIFITYGTAVGNNCKNQRQMLIVAENEMLKMKQKINVEITNESTQEESSDGDSDDEFEDEFNEDDFDEDDF